MCEQLDKLTNEHWTRGDPHWYIQNLLPLEMECAQQQVEECDTLALLVGFSEDPLLQTIWKYRPQRIVLILNSKYLDQKGNEQRGKQRAEQWVEYIRIMAQQGFCPQTAIPCFDRSAGERRDIAIATEEAGPDWVFRELRDRLLTDQRAEKRIVVDITGAKKNMASGAFLFAAYTGADISYVDFDEYHPEKRRPLGYTCRIGTQPNPYQILSLRDWERVQKLYEQFAFGSAAIEVQRLLMEMGAGLASAIGPGAYFSDEQRRAVGRLREVLLVLDRWDNGDYTSAWQAWELPKNNGGTSLRSKMPRFPLPHAIEYLGSRSWPSAEAKAASEFLQEHLKLKRGASSPKDSIFNQPDLLLTYAFDELQKIDRLVRYQNDYRSAFLRSAGLDELLLKSRVAILWLSDKLFISGKPRADFGDEHLKFGGLADYSSADNLRDFLRGVNRKNPGSPANLSIKYWDDDGKRRDFGLTRKDPSVKLMNKYWDQPQCAIDHETLVDLRGEAIHTHLSIPAAYAEAAYQIVACALKDFVENWVPSLGEQASTHQTWHLSWNDLCTHCKLDFLPALPSMKEDTK